MILYKVINWLFHLSVRSLLLVSLPNGRLREWSSADAIVCSKEESLIEAVWCREETSCEVFWRGGVSCSSRCRRRGVGRPVAGWTSYLDGLADH